MLQLLHIGRNTFIEISQGVSFFFDEYVSTNVYQLQHIGQNTFIEIISQKYKLGCFQLKHFATPPYDKL